MAPSATAESVRIPGQEKMTSPVSSKEIPREKTALESMGHRGRTMPGVPKFTSHSAQRQWQLEHMAGAFRVFASEGYAEGISGHISVRDPEFEDRFWINPLGIHFGMLKASDMVCVDIKGHFVGGNAVRIYFIQDTTRIKY